MDCCNYMQYRQQHNYYGGQYYEHPLSPYHADFYGQAFYQEYYGPSPYYQQQWQCSPFTDYVYNPKEARIRKAMREANRDRSLGASPMLPRPSARRPPHWMSHHEEQLMLSPLANMRAAMESPVCGFPLGGSGSSPGGGGGGQYMPAVGGYAKLEPQMPGTPVHSGYLQESPLAQLQQQTEMWHHPFTEPAPVRSSSAENPFMVPPSSPYPPQAMQNGLSPLTKQQQQQQQQQQALPQTPPIPSATGGPQKTRQEVAGGLMLPCTSVSPRVSDGDARNGDMFDGREKGMLEALTPMLEVETDPFAQPPYAEPDLKNAFVKVDKGKKEHEDEAVGCGDVEMEVPASTEEIYLPLSCQTLLVPQELLEGGWDYHQRYILAHFGRRDHYEVFTVTGTDNRPFPYVSAVSSPVSTPEAAGRCPAAAGPRFIPTDVGFVPLVEGGCGCGCEPAASVLDLTVAAAHRTTVACQTE